MKKITIIGFGNVGKSLIHKINKKFEVSILTFSKEKKSTEVITKFKEKKYINRVREITNNLNILLETDILIITIPNFLREDIIKKIKKFIQKKTVICFIPGIGPSQFLISKYLKENNVICLERVPFIVRIKNGIVEITDDRKLIKYATLNKNQNYDNLIEKIFNKPVEKIPYSTVTLTSSNAILHTSRIYALFKEDEKKIFDKRIYFYSEWDDEASIIFEKCDNEIMIICKKLKELKIIERNILSLMEYYESKNFKELTNKIKNIESLKEIELGMIKIENNKYILDKNIRFLTEDIPYGLIMFKGIAELLFIETPTIDIIIKWAQTILKKDYIFENKLIITENIGIGAPQYYGIKSKDKLKYIFSNN